MSSIIYQTFININYFSDFYRGYYSNDSKNRNNNKFMKKKFNSYFNHLQITILFE